MTDYIIVQILMAIIMSFVIFFLLDKLIIKYFKVPEITGAIIALIATLIYSAAFDQILLFYIFTVIWFIVALIAIYVDKKKEKERDKDINDGIDIN